MRRGHRYWAAALLLWLAAGAQALTPRFEPVGEAGGLRDAAVSALALDAQGFLWVGMPDGLQRFDGQVLKRYPLGARADGAAPDQFVRTLLADPRGGLWVAAGNSGLAWLDTASGHWTRWLRAEGEAVDARAPASNSVRALALEPDGTLWIGTQGGGLSRLDPQRREFRHVRAANAGLPDDRIASLLLDRQGTLWIGTWRGLARRPAGTERIERVTLGLAAPQITLLAETADGRILVGTAQGDLRALSAQGQPQPFAERAGPGDGAWPVLAMVQVSPDELWLGGRNGIERRRAGDGALIERLPPEGASPGPAPRSEVRALLRDPAGLIWAGSYGAGLMRHVPPLPGVSLIQHDLSRWRRFGDLDVRSVLQLASGELWLGTQAAGIVRLNSQLETAGEILPSAGPHGLPPGRITAMAQLPSGAIWVGAESELLHLDGQGRRLQQVPAGRAVPRRLMAAPDGSLWAGTADGLWRLPPGASTLQHIGLADGTSSSGEVNGLVVMPDGSLWAGGATGLLRVARPGDAKPVAEAIATQGLTGRTVVGLGVDHQGQLWVDTSAGLHRLTGADARQARFEAYPSASGSEVIGAFGANLLADREGRIWTHRGLFDPRTKLRRELNPVDGADFGNGWFRAYAALADGRFVFGGSRGLLVVQPERFAPWSYQPPLAATSLQVAGHEQQLPATGQPLVLAAGQRSFSLGFAALDYSFPARNRYRYRLDGLDSGWLEAGATSRLASYTNLEPGRYQLRVQGSNRDGAWSPQELTLDIEVRAAWWQTWWARAGAVAAALAAVLCIVRLRTRLLLQRQAALEARIAEATAALQQKSVELEEASLTDPLTGLRNRRFLEQQLPGDVALAVRRHERAEAYGHALVDLAGERSERSDSELLFFLIDIDHFKRVNDSQGHTAGDAVLTQMRGRLQQVFRATDYLIRWGGEEFLIVARGTPRARAAELAERARQAVAAQPFELDGGLRLALTCSVGFAAFPLCPAWPRALDWRQVVDLADTALYTAKRAGRNAWVGLLEARADSDTSLREDTHLALQDWAASGRLSLQKSS